MKNGMVSWLSQVGFLDNEKDVLHYQCGDGKLAFELGIDGYDSKRFPGKLTKKYDAILFLYYDKSGCKGLSRLIKEMQAHLKDEGAIYITITKRSMLLIENGDMIHYSSKNIFYRLNKKKKYVVTKDIYLRSGK